MTSRLPLETLGKRALERYRELVAHGSGSEIHEELAGAVEGLQLMVDQLRKHNAQLIATDLLVAGDRVRLQRLFDSCPDGYIVTDAIGSMRMVNIVAANVLGSSTTALKGKPLSTFVPLGFRPALRRLISGIAQHPETIRTLETPLVPRRGPRIFGVLRVRCVAEQGGELLWTLRENAAERAARDALVAEVAERRHIDESLRRIDLRYRSLIEHASDFIFELDELYRFTFANEFGVKLALGRSEREVLGRSLFDFTPRDFRDLLAIQLKKLSATPTASTYLECPLVGKDGSIRPFGQHITAVIRPNDRPGFHAIARDISPQIEQLSELRLAGEQLRGLSAHLQASVEAERKRIGREIHDELGATLTALRMELAMPVANSDGMDAYRHRDASLLRRLDAAIEAMRRILTGLRPSLLDNMGLCAALEWLAQDLDTRPGITCVAELQGLPREPDADCATALFRIAQEAVTNALRHSKATKLTLKQRCKGNRIEIDVHDNGVGIKRAQLTNRRAFGIVGMRERARAFGGTLEIRGGPRGTRVRVQMPLRADNGRAET